MEWINPTNHRYYRVFIIERDLLGDCVLVQEYGSLVTKRGGRLHKVLNSLEQGTALMRRINKVRLKHGYEIRALCKT